MYQWVKTGPDEWELFNARGLIVGFIERGPDGHWTWDGTGLFETGYASTRREAMDRVEGLVSPTVH
jgi:hypothetical protein